MSLTGTIIGALMAIVARPAREPDKGAAEKLARMVADLRLSRDQYINCVELLESELRVERQMSAHWLAETQRLIRENRRLERERVRQITQSVQQGLAQQNAQYAQAQQAPFHQQFAGAQGLGALGQCNCVPSRAQVWAAENALVDQLNQAGR